MRIEKAIERRLTVRNEHVALRVSIVSLRLLLSYTEALCLLPEDRMYTTSLVSPFLVAGLCAEFYRCV